MALEHSGEEGKDEEGEMGLEGEGELVFTFEVRKGDSPKSYGIHCARLAGFFFFLHIFEDTIFNFLYF